MFDKIYKNRSSGQYYSEDEVDNMASKEITFADIVEQLMTHLNDEMLKNLYESLPFELQCQINEEAKASWIFTHFEEYD